MRIDHHLLEMDRFTGSVIAKHPISSEKASIPIQASEFIEFYTYDEISDFIAAHEVPILSKENQFEIRKSGSPSGLSYEIHTGRELLMMIQGVKPLSVFSKYTWEEFDPYGGQKFEELHAQFGIQKQVHLEPDGLMRIFFCLPGEEWRITAYRNMREDMFWDGLSSFIVRLEGELLGYTEEQCDEYIEQWEENWHSRFNPPTRANSLSAHCYNHPPLSKTCAPLRHAW